MPTAHTHIAYLPPTDDNKPTMHRRPAPHHPVTTLQDGVTSLTSCRRVISHIEEQLQAAAGRLREGRQRVLRAREAVSFTLFRLVATRARASVSLAEVCVLRQIAELQRTSVDKVRRRGKRLGQAVLAPKNK